MMTEEERALTQRWVETWIKAGPKLDSIREQDIRASVTADGFRVFATFVRAALQTHPPEPTSGLVEQQRWFSKLPRRSE